MSDKTPYLGNPQKTIEVIQKYEFAFQKKFGQNFLIDTHVLDKIISAAEITKDDLVVEIGPGIGTMTQYLACAAREVVAIEIDKMLIKKHSQIRYVNVNLKNLFLILSVCFFCCKCVIPYRGITHIISCKNSLLFYNDKEKKGKCSNKLENV